MSHEDYGKVVLDHMSQTLFGHISINFSTILMVLIASESPWKDLLIDTSHISVSQTSFGHISTNSSTILTVSMAMESPLKDLSIDTSHASKRSVLAEILGRSTGNHYGTVY